MVRSAIGKALCESYDPSLRSSASVSDPSTSGANKIARERSTPTGANSAPRSDTVPAADYKTTSSLGSFFAIIGWIGVALSIVAGMVAAQTAGFAGIAAGVVAAFFCLMTVAAGQLLQAQVEVANNSRLILSHLETLNRVSD